MKPTDICFHLLLGFADVHSFCTCTPLSSWMPGLLRTIWLYGLAWSRSRCFVWSCCLVAAQGIQRVKGRFMDFGWTRAKSSDHFELIVAAVDPGIHWCFHQIIDSRDFGELGSLGPVWLILQGILADLGREFDRFFWPPGSIPTVNKWTSALHSDCYGELKCLKCSNSKTATLPTRINMLYSLVPIIKSISSPQDLKDAPVPWVCMCLFKIATPFWMLGRMVWLFAAVCLISYLVQTCKAGPDQTEMTPSDFLCSTRGLQDSLVCSQPSSLGRPGEVTKN